MCLCWLMLCSACSAQHALLSMLCSACLSMLCSACYALHALAGCLLGTCASCLLHAACLLPACERNAKSPAIKQPASSQQASSQQPVRWQVASTSNSIPAAGACERSPAMRNTQHIKQPATACLAFAVNRQQAGSKPQLAKSIP